MHRVYTVLNYRVHFNGISWTAFGHTYGNIHLEYWYATKNQTIFMQFVCEQLKCHIWLMCVIVRTTIPLLNILLAFNKNYVILSPISLLQKCEKSKKTFRTIDHFLRGIWYASKEFAVSFSRDPIVVTNYSLKSRNLTICHNFHIIVFLQIGNSTVMCALLVLFLRQKIVPT